MRFVLWVAAVVAVSLISIMLSQRGTTDPVQNLSLTITAPLESGLRDVASPIDDIVEGVFDHGDLVRENERLRQELERLQGQRASQQDAQQRVAVLQEALGVKQDRPEDKLLAASVIAQEPSGLKREIAIDRGLSDGVDEGMVVLSRNGSLVGTVSRVYKDFAWVRLVTDPDSAINAQVNASASAPQTPAPQASATPAFPTATPGVATSPGGGAPGASPVGGVAVGDLRQGVVLDLLPSDSPITQGDLVVTSGLGGNYPRALLIGSIKKIEERPQAPFQAASVQPAASLSSLDTVLVLISFRPARLTGP